MINKILFQAIDLKKMKKKNVSFTTIKMNLHILL